MMEKPSMNRNDEPIEGQSGGARDFVRTLIARGTPADFAAALAARITPSPSSVEDWADWPPMADATSENYLAMEG